MVSVSTDREGALNTIVSRQLFEVYKKTISNI